MAMSRIVRALRDAKNYLIYVLVRGGVSFLRMIPLSFGRPLAIGLSHMVCLVARQRRKIALRNLKEVFGSEKSDEEIRQILKKYFFNIVFSILEFAHLSRWGDDDIQKKVLLEGIENYRNGYEKGKGIIFISGHFGNFGLLGHAGSLLVTPISFVVPKRKPTALNRYLEKQLCSFGNQMVPKGLSFLEQLEPTLHAGKALGLVIDQRGGKGATLAPVNLLGRRFHLNKGPALIAARWEVPVIPVFIFRENNGRHRIEIGKEVPMLRTGPQDEAIKENMQRMVDSLEGAIKKAPDHWLYWAWRGFEKDFKSGVTEVKI